MALTDLISSVSVLRRFRLLSAFSRPTFTLFFLLCLCPLTLRPQAGKIGTVGLTPVELRISGLEAPVGLDEQQPFFGWQLHAGSVAQHDIAQFAYRILVASSPGLPDRQRGDLWDSGRIKSGDFIHAPYAGRPLQSHTTYFWKVCVWSSPTRRSTCSATSRWTTALLHPDDWIAKWIAAKPDGPLEPQALEGMGESHSIPETLPLFRHSFEVSKPVRSAIVFISGLGQYELHLNGHPITNAVMTPGWTNYRKEVLYNTYDITNALTPGVNTFGVMLGNGMYNVPGIEGRYTKFIGSFGNPKMILQMHIIFVDGTQQIIASDRTWQTSPGPIVLSSIYGGEDYDARKEPPGWDTSPTSSWSYALEVAAPSGSKDSGKSLRSLLIPPMKVVEVIRPVRQSELRPDAQIYDLGRNFSGWPEIQVKGHAGDTIRILPGELLDRNGEVTQRSASAGKSNPVLFTYTLAGDAAETWHPRFTYYGFRYVQAQTVPVHEGERPPTILSLEGHFVHDDVPVDGLFRSEAPLLNDVHHLIDQAILSNLASVLSDCPTREKLGWLEQTYLNGGSIMYNYGVAQLYRKVADDMSEAQVTDGMVPGIAPEYVAFVDKNGKSTAFRDSPEWGSAIILSPWAAYQFYGDLEVLASHYDSMVRYSAYLKSKSINRLLTFGLGDWYDVGPLAPGESQLTSKGLTATAIYYEDLVTLAHIATLLNKPADATRYTNEASEVKIAFNDALYHPATKAYDQGSQTANAMPLYLGLVPEQDRAPVLANLVADIRAHHNHVTAGDVGFHYVVDALTEYGRSDVIYDMLTQTDSPSYGYQLSRGATTLTEAWDTNPGSSQNHFMLGHGEEWFYRGLAGIDFDLSRRNADRIRLRPALESGASDASATVNTVLGQISSSWHRNGKDWSAKFVIPAGCQATLILPAGAISREVQIHGATVNNSESFAANGRHETRILGSGSYTFTGSL
jgi:alpha-L-rhamnosidase